MPVIIHKNDHSEISFDNPYQFMGGYEGKSRYVQVICYQYSTMIRYDLWGWLSNWLTPSRAVRKAFEYIVHIESIVDRGRSRSSASINEIKAQVEVEHLLKN